MGAHARLKNEFTEDEKYHNIMRWLNLIHVLFLPQIRGIRVPGHGEWTWTGTGTLRTPNDCLYEHCNIREKAGGIMTRELAIEKGFI